MRKIVDAYPALYQDGHLAVENSELIEKLNLRDCLFGVQVAHDGRVWVCVNGVAYLRFKPGPVAGG